jgi:Flp pilus assembly protein TadG
MRTRNADETRPSGGLVRRLAARSGRRGAGAGRRRRLGCLASLYSATGGVSAVEFAVMAPVLLILLLPIADLGLAFSQRLQLAQAVQSGAQYAASNPWHNKSPAEITNAVNAASDLSGTTVEVCGCPYDSAVSAASCGTTCSDSGISIGGNYAVVSAQLLYTPVLPYSVYSVVLPPTLEAQSVVRVQ